MKRRTILQALLGAIALPFLPKAKPTLEVGPNMGDYTLTPGYMEPGTGVMLIMDEPYGQRFTEVKIYTKGKLTGKYLLDRNGFPPECWDNLVQNRITPNA